MQKEIVIADITNLNGTYYILGKSRNIVPEKICINKASIVSAPNKGRVMTNVGIT